MKNEWYSVKGLTFIAFMMIVVGVFSYTNFTGIGKALMIIGAIIASAAVLMTIKKRY